MYHTIIFDQTLTLEMETTQKEPLERRSVKKGTQVRAQLKPHVLDTKKGPVEVADLYFEDGTASRRVRYAFFSFVD
jgi:hypothetical protein